MVPSWKRFPVKRGGASPEMDVEVLVLRSLEQRFLGKFHRDRKHGSRFTPNLVVNCKGNFQKAFFQG